jgi:hypothetical protein
MTTWYFKTFLSRMHAGLDAPAPTLSAEKAEAAIAIRDSNSLSGGAGEPKHHMQLGR